MLQSVSINELQWGCSEKQLSHEVCADEMCGHKERCEVPRLNLKDSKALDRFGTILCPLCEVQGGSLVFGVMDFAFKQKKHIRR